MCTTVALYVQEVLQRGRMPLIKLKHKGQMTIPAEIRDQLQLQQGDLLEASTDGRAIILVPKAVVDREAFEGERSHKSQASQ